ncbi:MAG: class I SAM-dependent methyltransferase [Alphaproteobacteria bacterium]|nr:class I SAM-dependent methyltransferase [Alphaproteobacteria bacterium]
MVNPEIAAPAPWVVRFAPLVPHSGGAVLDLACGSGRHLRYLLALGHHVIGIDRNITVARAIADPRLSTIPVDLEANNWPFAGHRFSAIIVTNYLHRPLFPHITAALEPGGVLIYETFARGNERWGRPNNPAFLLAPGELLTAFSPSLHIIGYEHGLIEGSPPRVVQRLCGCKPSPELDPAVLGIG